MITLQKDGKVMEVCTELQASVFERSGYKRVVRGQQPEVVAEPKEVPINPPEMVAEPAPEPEPAPKKRRRRTAKKAEEE